MNIDVAGTVAFGPSSVWLVPRVSGVYVIHDLRGSGYVGRTGNLRRRFGDHIETSWNPALCEFLRTAIGPLAFSWIPMLRDECDHLERALVRRLNPVANRMRYGAGARAPP